MEKLWENALKKGETVAVRIDIKYSGDSLRPEKFEIISIIDQEMSFEEFINIAGGGKK